MDEAASNASIKEETKKEHAVENEERGDAAREVEIEILAPFKIPQFMKVVDYIDSMPEVTQSEIIPISDKPVIQVLLSEYTDLTQKLMTLSCIEKIEEADEVPPDDGSPDQTIDVPKRIQITLIGNEEQVEAV